MKEIALKIGKPIPLTAIVSLPEQLNPERPAVLILNSGIMHHVGACRLSVKIARQLANSGTLAIRFDLSGIGDSAPRAGAGSFHETAIAEVKEVMDYLSEKRGINKFIAYGLCSGADASYDIALADERIVGIAQIDPYCYRTWSWYVRYYGPKLFKLSVWWHSIKIRLFKEDKDELGFSESVEEENLEMPSYIRVFPERSEVAKGMQALVNRGVKLLCLFTDGQNEIINHGSQFKQSMPEVSFGDALTVDYQAEMDHIITAPHMQKYARDLICNWSNQVADQA